VQGLVRAYSSDRTNVRRTNLSNHWIGVAHYLWIPGQSSKLAHDRVGFIQTWPGIDEVQNKVQTRVAYKAGNARTKWGFQCSSDEADGYITKKYFKLFLEPAMLRAAELDEVSQADVKLWFTDFLVGLYDWIQVQLERDQTYHDFVNQGMVEYIFSVPTTWNSQEVIDDFKEVIAAAGFRNATIGLTEAEAAAVSTLVDMNTLSAQGSEMQNSEYLSRMPSRGGGPNQFQHMVYASPGNLLNKIFIDR
jgi:hypothetical protein